MPSSRFLRTHGKLWFDSAVYRWSWLILPQAVALTLMGLFVMDGGMATLFNQNATPFEQKDVAEWGNSGNNNDMALVPLRDKAGKEGSAEALAALEKMAERGDIEASYYLATLYDPDINLFPYPKTKDVKRALQLYRPGVDKKKFNAQYQTIRNYTLQQSSAYDPVAGCEVAREIAKHPEFRNETNKPEEDWLKMTVADCLAGIHRPQNAPFVEPNKADAEAAIALYEEPRLIIYLDAKRIVSLTYLRPTSPVKDIARGCSMARTWVDQVANSNYTYTDNDKDMLVNSAGCLLNVFRPADVPYTVPAITDQNKAIALLEQPVLKNDSYALRIATIAYWNDKLAIKDLEKAKEKARLWALSSDQEKELPVSSVVIFAADSLMGILGGANPHQPNQKEIEIARNLYTRVADAGDVTAWHRVGFISELGVGTWVKDMNKARQAYEKCQDGFVGCQERLGAFQEFGWGGLSKDPSAALKVYQACSKIGSAFCDSRLATFHVDGLGGLPRNPAVAMNYARRAAEAGSGPAAELYAILLFNGNSATKPDYEAAARWMVMAVERNPPTLQWLQDTARGVIKAPAFWTSFHQELKARSVYYGPISGMPTAATFEAAAKLAPR